MSSLLDTRCGMNNGKRTQLMKPGTIFFVVGLVFFILGISGQTAFLGIGIAFFTLGLVFIAQAKKDKDKQKDKDAAP